MNKIRVLVVDDSVVVRRLVTDLLASDPVLEVVATAPNGRIALDKLPSARPDVVILDVEMPEMDGLQTLTALRREYPVLPVVMFSQHTQRGAAVTLEALAQGANDYVTKPDPAARAPEVLEQVREQLVTKIKGLFPSVRLRPSRQGSSPAVSVDRGPAARVEVIVVGVSTGGPNTLATLLPSLPAEMPVPLVIVQHMPALFTRLLAQRLAADAPWPVTEAVADQVLLAGRALVCPGDHHLELLRLGAQVRVLLNQGPPENSCRPSVDVLFRSAASAYGGGVLGVILTGMGQDGVAGCRWVREAGGQVLVQDEATSVVWGMPGAVVRAGLADRVVPLPEMAPEIVSRLRRGRTPSTAAVTPGR